MYVNAQIQAVKKNRATDDSPSLFSRHVLLRMTGTAFVITDDLLTLQLLPDHFC